jgi:hypothetical protein
MGIWGEKALPPSRCGGQYRPINASNAEASNEEASNAEATERDRCLIDALGSTCQGLRQERSRSNAIKHQFYVSGNLANAGSPPQPTLLIRENVI